MVRYSGLNIGLRFRAPNPCLTELVACVNAPVWIVSITLCFRSDPPHLVIEARQVVGVFRRLEVTLPCPPHLGVAIASKAARASVVYFVWKTIYCMLYDNYVLCLGRLCAM